jgi:hypothetical protein
MRHTWYYNVGMVVNMGAMAYSLQQNSVMDLTLSSALFFYFVFKSATIDIDLVCPSVNPFEADKFDVTNCVQYPLRQSWRQSETIKSRPDVGENDSNSLGVDDSIIPAFMKLSSKLYGGLKAPKLSLPIRDPKTGKLLVDNLMECITGCSFIKAKILLHSYNVSLVIDKTHTYVSPEWEAVELMDPKEYDVVAVKVYNRLWTGMPHQRLDDDGECCDLTVIRGSREGLPRPYGGLTSM